MVTTKGMLTGLLALGALAGFAAADGSTEAKAVSLTPKSGLQAREIELWPQEPSGTNGVFFLKMMLQKRKAYTVWLEDEQAAPGGDGGKYIAISETYPGSNQKGISGKLIDKFDVNPPSADFEMVSSSAYTGWVMTGEHWEKEEGSWQEKTGDDIKFKVPSTWTYFIVVKGKPGEKAKFCYQLGNQIPKGLPQNPLVITPKTAPEGQWARDLKFWGSDYNVKTAFEIGRRYYLATEGGSESNQLSIDITLPPGTMYDHDGWKEGDFNASKVFVPNATETAIWKICTSKTNDFPDSVGLRYRVDPARKLSEHPFVQLLTAKSVRFQPGNVNRRDSGAYDAIIDEQLFKFSAAKGKNYLIEANWVAEATNMLMRVYDANGKVLAENRGNGTNLNTRCAIVAPKKTTDYYVGVCQDLGDREDFDTPAYLDCDIKVSQVTPQKVAAVPVEPKAVKSRTYPTDGDDEPVEVAGFGRDVWERTFVLNARALMWCTVTYNLHARFVDGGETSDLALEAEVYYLKGGKEKLVGRYDFMPGVDDLSFAAAATTPYYLRLRVKDGQGLDYPAFRIYAVVSCTTVNAKGKTVESPIGTIQVAPRGTTAGKWSLSGDKTSFGWNRSTVVPTGKWTIKYGSVKGFKAPPGRTVTVNANELVRVDTDCYTDTFDPKDDRLSGQEGKVKFAPTSWTLKDKATVQKRTLWEDDAADHFAFTAKAEYYYSFALEREGASDAVLSVLDAQGVEVGEAASNVTSVARLRLPAGRHYLRVSHGTDEHAGGGYELTGSYANAGTVKFEKKAVSVKDTDTSVKLSVARSGGKNGSLSVLAYFPGDDDTAKAGEQYVAQPVLLKWADGDSKKKTVTVNLIPKLGPWYTGSNLTFTVKLVDSSLGADYPATIALDACTVTIKQTAKATVTRESVYAKKLAKGATVKKDEDVGVETGAFSGLLQAAGDGATNGLPEFASISLSSVAAKGKKAAQLTAKVTVAGKAYSFKSTTGWAGEEPPVEAGGLGSCSNRLTLVTKVNKRSYTNVLDVVMPSGGSTTNDWRKAIGLIALQMNVPDPDGKGVQSLRYSGSIFRDNAKVQGYLDWVKDFAGYYTFGLVPIVKLRTNGSKADEGAVPEGSGYLTMTISNKGAVKLAGMLPDGTKISQSTLAVCHPANLDCLLVLVCQCKSPYLAALQLVVDKDGVKYGDEPDGRGFGLVSNVGMSNFVWNNDNRKLASDGEQGWRISAAVVGGWYDTVFNLQSYYRDYALRIGGVASGAFPKELLADGYRYHVGANPFLEGGFLNNGLSLPTKRSLVKDVKLYDLDQGSNVCNLQVKFARATGVLSGTFSLWSENESGSVQKEIKGFKHYGVAVLQDPLEMGVFSFGFALKDVKVTEKDAKGKKQTRTWKWSQPFLSSRPCVSYDE